MKLWVDILKRAKNQNIYTKNQETSVDENAVVIYRLREKKNIKKRPDFLN